MAGQYLYYLIKRLVIVVFFTWGTLLGLNKGSEGMLQPELQSVGTKKAEMSCAFISTYKEFKIP